MPGAVLPAYVKVEIWSDVVCPWCYIGKRRFEKALAAFEHADAVEVVYRSFELDPSYEGPPEPTAQMLARKYQRPVSAVLPMFEQVRSLAREEGIELRPDGTSSGNTFDAHRLIHFAHTQGRGHELVERLFGAYFTQLRSVFDTDTLVALAQEVGLDGDQARAVLASDAFAGEVRADEAQARAYGATGVPFFVLDGRYGISGAQPQAVFAESLQRAWATRRPLETVVAAAPEATDGAPAAGCDEGACTI